MSEYPQLIVSTNSDPGDPWCTCPNCGWHGPLMSSFSLLKAGFNGIKPGDPDDLDLQECGGCEAKLKWDNVETKEAKDATKM